MRMLLRTGFFFLATLIAHAVEAELQVRGGLPHLAALARADASGQTTLRVAYLGGSITAAAEGWRSLTTAHLRQRFPQLTVIEIPAGLPGTGSNLGACRLAQDVLRHEPDLVFVEFAVNDSATPPDRIQRSIEGIVRQTRRALPATDLFFVYTVSTPGLPALQAGEFPASARAMEVVAGHYGIPSLHFGVEVARQVTAGTLLFKAAPATPSVDVPVFSHDGAHPTAAGHRLYFAAVERSLPLLLEASTTVASTLPAPLHVDNWEHASLRPMDDVSRTGDWIRVPPDDPNLRGATTHLLPPTWRATQPGSFIEFEFSGRQFGLLGIAAPDSGEFRVTVDEQPAVTATFFDAYVTPTFCRQREWFYPSELPDGPHRVRVELLPTVLVKAAIKSAGGRPLDDAPRYASNHLTLAGVLLVGSSAAP